MKALPVLHPLAVLSVLRRVLQRQGGLIDALLPGLKGLVLDVADEPALVGVGHLGRALDGRGAADHGLHLAALEVGRAGQGAERVGRVRRHVAPEARVNIALERLALDLNLEQAAQ